MELSKAEIAQAALALHREHRGPTFPWYDSRWLTDFIAATNYIEHAHPEHQDAFAALIAPLRTRPDFLAHHLPSFLDREQHEMIRACIDDVIAAPVSVYERSSFGRDIMHDRPEFTQLASQLAPYVSDLVGEHVAPCYNFLSLYGNSGVCLPHLDTPQAKWTLDICIDQSAPWPIHVSEVVPWPTSNNWVTDDWADTIKRSHSFDQFVLEPGDALVFAGSSQWHYRDPIPDDSEQGFANLLFLHYVPTGSAATVEPSTWANHLGLNGLSNVLRSRPDRLTAKGRYGQRGTG